MLDALRRLMLALAGGTLLVLVFQKVTLEQTKYTQQHYPQDADAYPLDHVGKRKLHTIEDQYIEERELHTVDELHHLYGRQPAAPIEGNEQEIMKAIAAKAQQAEPVNGGEEGDDGITVTETETIMGVLPIQGDPEYIMSVIREVFASLSDATKGDEDEEDEQDTDEDENTDDPDEGAGGYNYIFTSPFSGWKDDQSTTPHSFILDPTAEYTPCDMVLTLDSMTVTIPDVINCVVTDNPLDDNDAEPTEPEDSGIPEDKADCTSYMTVGSVTVPFYNSDLCGPKPTDSTEDPDDNSLEDPKDSNSQDDSEDGLDESEDSKEEPSETDDSSEDDSSEDASSEDASSEDEPNETPTPTEPENTTPTARPVMGSLGYAASITSYGNPLTCTIRND